MIATQRMNFLVCSLTSPPPQRSTVSVCSVGIDTQTPIDGDLYTSLQSGDLSSSTGSNLNPQLQPTLPPNFINHQVVDHPRVANLNNTAPPAQSMVSDPSIFPVNHHDKPPVKVDGRVGDEVPRREREAVEEGGRERRDEEMFAKLPRESYTGLSEGVSALTQLLKLNPDPPIPSVNHPSETGSHFPRTTRSTELSESLWADIIRPHQSPNDFTPGLRPPTSFNEGQASGSGSRDADKSKSESKEERRKRALDRNRSWADEYHYSGW